MTRYAVLLRGVNVGGVTIKSVELAEAVRSAGFDDVKTVLASGNVLLTSSLGEGEVADRLEDALGRRFEYQARVHVVSLDELRRVVDACPFPARDGWHRYVIFLLRGAPDILVPEGLDPALEHAELGDGVIYWTVERGHTLDSPFSKHTSTGAGRGATTNRNVNTLEKLLR